MVWEEMDGKCGCPTLFSELPPPEISETPGSCTMGSMLSCQGVLRVSTPPPETVGVCVRRTLTGGLLCVCPSGKSSRVGRDATRVTLSDRSCPMTTSLGGGWLQCINHGSETRPLPPASQSRSTSGRCSFTPPSSAASAGPSQSLLSMGSVMIKCENYGKI